MRILDFDGTVVDDQSDFSAWRTYWILQRVDQVHNMGQDIPAAEGAPTTIQVSFREYMRYLSGFARNNLFNSLVPVRLERDPVFRGRRLEIVPGWYQVVDAITFKYYRPAGTGKNYLLRDYRMAEERARLLNERAALEGQTGEHAGRRYDWRGPAFDLLRAGMSDPSSVGDTKIFSARWHTDAEVQELMDAWAADGVIRYSRGVSFNGAESRLKFHSLMSPEARLLSRDPRQLAARKAQVIQNEAMALLHAPYSGSGRHTLIAAEDDPRNIEAVMQKMRELSTSGDFAFDIKFVFLNTSLEEDFRKSGHRFRYTVFERDGVRAATADEITEWTRAAERPDAVGPDRESKRERSRSSNACEAFFITGGGR